jgi:4a-hydroxytetrahydrobiopterin dehydratase
MSKLSNERCEACRIDAPRLNDDEIRELLPKVQGWNLVTIEGINRLTRQFKFKNFIEALAFTNEVAEIAEVEDHHPAILTEWGSVEVTWWTHKIKGLHRNDFVMAARTNAILGN